MQCECGCGYEGEDDVTQYLVEEACLTALKLDDARLEREALDAQEQAEVIGRSQSRRDKIREQIGG